MKLFASDITWFIVLRLNPSASRESSRNSCQDCFLFHGFISDFYQQASKHGTGVSLVRTVCTKAL